MYEVDIKESIHGRISQKEIDEILAPLMEKHKKELAELYDLLDDYGGEATSFPLYCMIRAALEKAIKEKKIYPNNPCPCGSGKKYKKCCMHK